MSDIGKIPPTAIVSYPMPMIPSNLAKTQANPGSLVLAANVTFLASRPPRWKVSLANFPSSFPDPYCISKGSSVLTKEDDLPALNLLWNLQAMFVQFGPGTHRFEDPFYVSQ